MRIKVRSGDKVPFSTLRAGDVFDYDGRFYLRVSRRDRDPVINSARLCDGMVWAFSDDVQVRPVDGVFVEDEKESEVNEDGQTG